MTKTQKKAGAAPDSKAAVVLPLGAVREVEGALKQLEGHWKMLALFHLFTQPVLRLADLQSVAPVASHSAVAHQLAELEREGLLHRAAQGDPPEVEYTLTTLGKGLRPALSALREWAVLRRVQI
jgi:DNA-binding HxlR family transcriptional regulator